MNNFFEKVSNIFLRKNSNGKGINLSRIKKSPSCKVPTRGFCTLQRRLFLFHGLQVGAKNQLAAGSLLNLLLGVVGMELCYHDSFRSYFHNPHFSYNHGNTLGSSQRQCTLLQNLVGTFLGVNHGNDYLLGTNYQVSGRWDVSAQAKWMGRMPREHTSAVIISVGIGYNF